MARFLDVVELILVCSRLGLDPVGVVEQVAEVVADSPPKVLAPKRKAQKKRAAAGRRGPRRPKPWGEWIRQPSAIQSDSERSAEAAATFFTLIESARRAKMNLWEYLTDLLERLPVNRLEELLPDRWQPNCA